MTSKTTAARMAALRVRRAALGLKRLELYLHSGDYGYERELYQ